MAAREAELMQQIAQLTEENRRLHSLIFECAESVILEAGTPAITQFVNNAQTNTKKTYQDDLAS